MMSVQRILVLTVLALFASGLPAFAQSIATRSANSDGAAAGEATTLTIGVIGDSLGNGLWEGLHLYLRKDKRVVVARHAKHSVGFAESDMTDQIDEAFAQGPVSALVIMIGANDDRKSFFENGRARALFATTKWAELYRGRIDAFMDHAGKRGVPLIWVQLPVMRSAEATRAAKAINEIVSAAAATRSFVALVDAWSTAAGANGEYRAHFEDLDGKRTAMRDGDGLHFTRAGYRVLAHKTLEKLREVAPSFRAISLHAATEKAR